MKSTSTTRFPFLGSSRLRSSFAIGALTSLAFSLTIPAADPFAENVRTTDPLTPEQQQKTFHLPPGFEIQLVAAEPDINKPMNMAFDAKGRLWVTTSREYPFPAPIDKPGRDRIMIFEDFGPDGRARKVTQFADGLNIPIGIYPYADGAIVWSIPNIWFFHDTDGDGKADRKEVLFGPFDHTRDTHGNQASFRRGFDGWLYATHGYNNDSQVKGRDGHEVHMNSGNTYRIRLDGSRIEQHTWGQVNPFGLAWDPLGNLYSSDCHSAPTYQLLAGGYYPSFGKPHDGLGFAPVLMEHSHGSTAIDGMAYYADNLWPDDFRDNTFIGNVMTSRVNRDRLTFNGSSPKANELPDFVTTDDPWFRPVDNQLGPDGAFYIADFYNRIIGHYEVPLLHPGRDRERGRIWRVLYRGSDGQPKLHQRTLDLTKASAVELIRELADPNLTWRMLAMNQLCDRIGKDAVQPARQAMRTALPNASSSPEQAARADEVMHLLWVLNRVGGLDEDTLKNAASNRDRAVRVHTMRILAERGLLARANLPVADKDSASRELAIARLQDADALVQRCAAEALGNDPQFENLRPLLALRHRVPAADTHLLYVVRKAIRDQLKVDGVLARLQMEKLSEADERAVADVAVGISSAGAGEFLLRHIQQYSTDKETLTDYLRHSARYAPEKEMDTLASFTRKKFADDVDFQLALFKSVQQGTEQRGATLRSSVEKWGEELATQLLRSVDDNSLTWINTPPEGATRSTNPWFVQQRPSSDGDKGSLFLCSLPPGGEQLTGILRSQLFTVPAKLSFYVAGHDGFPDKPAKKKNAVRLRTADAREVLAETFAPRNDLAQPVTWDLTTHAGKKGFLEIADGDDGTAYAWLAVGRFNPPVVSVPAMNPNVVGQRQQAAAELARSLPVPALEPQLARILVNPSTELDTCAVVARALVALRPNETLAALAPLVGDPAVPVVLRQRINEVLVGKKSNDAQAVLLETIRTSPRRVQIKLAQGLASSAAGAEELLKLVADRQAPANLLLERSVKDKLLATKQTSVRERIVQLTEGLSPASDQIQRLLDRRRAAYDPNKANLAKGDQVFTQNCRVCHQLGGIGNVVGPQLDGIGNRGLERIVEDVLDPNRNVDRAFRNTLLALNDGDVVSGLFRREEGEMVVLAEATGKEISIPKKQIKERRETETSLMPENFGDVIPPEDFNHLIAYLLSKASRPPEDAKSVER